MRLLQPFITVKYSATMKLLKKNTCMYVYRVVLGFELNKTNFLQAFCLGNKKGK
jgi:hypothetical protein